jgi:hypothetical protein
MEPTPEHPTIKFRCECCDYNTSKLSNWNEHIITAKHLKRTNQADRLPVKKDITKRCETCDYTTSKLSNWNMHILTAKHKRLTMPKNDKPIRAKKAAHVYACGVCDIQCVSESILKRHQLTKSHQRNAGQCCPTNPSPAVEQNAVLTSESIRAMMTDYAEFKQMVSRVLVETANKPTTVINNIVSSNNSNNRFNINVFLNEKCANAQNMSDFIAGIEVTHEDLENNAHLGFVGGMVKIFKDNLDKLAVTERPIHCTDSKRDTLYIKDNDQWSKDGSMEKMNECIQTISRRGVGNLMSWKRENAEEYKDINSAFSDKCFQIHRTLMAGDDRDTLYPKVVRAIAEQVSLRKEPSL